MRGGADFEGVHSTVIDGRPVQLPVAPPRLRASNLSRPRQTSVTRVARAPLAAALLARLATNAPDPPA